MRKPLVLETSCLMLLTETSNFIFVLHFSDLFSLKIQPKIEKNPNV